MTECFGYIRVSTAKQGEGVSLLEQRASIERYARKNSIVVSEWFEEKETAAKRGRPVFSSMLKQLKNGAASGVIIHKIDRSARNLKDWVDLGELIDVGVSIHFANEGLDLKSRGGRLSADIQAVVAADYIRNLREEAKKGFYGRLKQGVLPLPAPVGYLDKGAGIPKAVDPKKGPLVRKAFELYAGGQYSLESLSEKLAQIGLVNRKGVRLSPSSLSVILKNPFYIGLMRIKSTGEVFEGGHKPLITKELFDRVQAMLSGKCNTKKVRHSHQFRRILTCALCGNRLVGEKQKGHTYYRCHKKNCAMKCIREEVIEQAVEAKLWRITFTDDEMRYMHAKLEEMGATAEEEAKTTTKELHMQLGALQTRLMRLTDAFVDGSVEKDIYEERKEQLLLERCELQDRLTALSREPQEKIEEATGFLELAQSAWLSYTSGNSDEKRRMVRIATSNLTVSPKCVAVELSNPLSEIERRVDPLCSGPHRGIPRTNIERVIDKKELQSLPYQTKNLLKTILRTLFSYTDSTSDSPATKD